MMNIQSAHWGRRAACAAVLAVSAAVLMTGCKKKTDHLAGTASAQTVSSAEDAEKDTVIGGADGTTDITITEASSQPADSSKPSSPQSSQMETYTSGLISIQYPVFTGLTEDSQQAAVNDLLKQNALAVLDGYEVDQEKDSLTVTSKVISADRSRIVVTYSGVYTPAGAAHPVNLFYTSTIDAEKGTNIQLSRYADPAVLADYVLSGQAILPNASGDQKTAIQKEFSEEDKNYYTDLFRNADFSDSSSFPECFSYEDEGDIYFSVPVSHAAGDYAIVVYVPENK